MQITLQLPEDIADRLESKWKDLPRGALESPALEAYRFACPDRCTASELSCFETRMEVDAFLKEHEIFDYSAADFEEDRKTLRDLPMKEARS